MSKIAEAFSHGKAFIPFITCGDPDLETTAAAVRAAVDNGAAVGCFYRIVVEKSVYISHPFNPVGNAFIAYNALVTAVFLGA